MAFEIEWDEGALRFFLKLQKDIQERILNKLEIVRENPFHYLEHYEGGDYYKLRIGVFRALVDVDFNRKILIIQVFDKRGRIYKR